MDNFDKDRIATAIVRMLDGSMTEKERNSLVKWLEESPENRAEFRKTLSLWNIPDFEKVSKIDIRRASDHIKEHISVKPQKRWKKLLINAAAALAIPLAAATLYLGFSQRSLMEAKMIETYVPQGARSKVVLPDNTIVHLNSGSKLAYNTVFKKNDRKVILDGEGYFEVVSSENDPFTVETEHFTLICTGTVFNVRSYSSDPEHSATLVNGKVNISIGDRQISLKPNERITVSQNGNHNISKVDPYRFYAWKNGEVVFRNDRLEDVLKQLSQTYNYDFVIKDAELKKYSVHATFKNETIHEMISLMECILPVRCKLTPSKDARKLGTIEISRNHLSF